METGHPSTRAVNSGSGNRALGLVLRLVLLNELRVTSVGLEVLPSVELARTANTQSLESRVHTAIPTPIIPTPVIPTPVLAVYFSQIHALKHFIY